ncbi:MAG: hypothetical protein ACP5U1_15915 [Desulfomonilaceae bacterium]
MANRNGKELGTAFKVKMASDAVSELRNLCHAQGIRYPKSKTCLLISLKKYLLGPGSFIDVDAP